jgi:hypothetical protein
MTVYELMKSDDGVADGCDVVVIAAICDASPLGFSFFTFGFFEAVSLVVSFEVSLAVSFVGSGILTSPCGKKATC